MEKRHPGTEIYRKAHEAWELQSVLTGTQLGTTALGGQERLERPLLSTAHFWPGNAGWEMENADHFLKAVVGPFGSLFQASGRESWLVLWAG